MAAPAGCDRQHGLADGQSPRVATACRPAQPAADRVPAIYPSRTQPGRCCATTTSGSARGTASAAGRADTLSLAHPWGGTTTTASAASSQASPRARASPGP